MSYYREIFLRKDEEAEKLTIFHGITYYNVILVFHQMENCKNDLAKVKK